MQSGRPAFLLDGDNLRHGINGDLGFSDDDRKENVRRAGEVARMFAESGSLALIALICPFAEDRRLIRMLHEDVGLPFLEVFVDTPLEECERRDPKGLYARARAGQLPGFTGIDAEYEAPAAPDLVLSPSVGHGFRAGLPRAGAAGAHAPLAGPGGPEEPSPAAGWSRADGTARSAQTRAARRRRPGSGSAGTVAGAPRWRGWRSARSSSSSPPSRCRWCCSGRRTPAVARLRGRRHQPTLSSHTLLRLPAASAVAEQGASAWVTDDLRDLLVAFDPATGKAEHSMHLAGRPVAMVLANGPPVGRRRGRQPGGGGGPRHAADPAQHSRAGGADEHGGAWTTTSG